MLNTLLQKKERPVLGIDIGNFSVKVLELSHSMAGYCIEAAGVASIPNQAVVDHVIRDPLVVGNSITKAVEHSSTKIKNAVVAVSGPSVMTKVTKVSASLSQSEMETKVFEEASNYLPYPMDEIAIDFEPLQLDSNDPELLEVLIVACKQEKIDNIIEAFSNTNLKVLSVDVEMYGLERAFNLIQPKFKKSRNSNIAFIDLGYQKTSLNIMKKGSLVYTKDEAFGNQQLLEEIQKSYSMDVEKSRMLLHENQLPKNYQEEILNPFTESVIQELSRSLQLYYSAENTTPVDEIIVTGGSLLAKTIAEKLQKKLELKSTATDLFSQIKNSKNLNINLIETSQESFIAACGLSMKRGNMYA